MSVRWEHKPFSKESNVKGLCFGLAGAGFNSRKSYENLKWRVIAWDYRHTT